MPNPPKWDPVQRSRGSGPVKLPAEGRKGATPPWPLDDGMSVGEELAWGQLWATPQAVMWERMSWLRMVARYCRVMVAAEGRKAPASLLAQAVVLEDRLGLSPKSMRLMLWEVVADEVGERAAAGTDVRGRIRAVG